MIPLYGTLLGAVRNRELICYDFDIDVGFIGREYDRVRAAIPRFLEEHPEYAAAWRGVLPHFAVLYDKATGINIDIGHLEIRDGRVRRRLPGPDWLGRWWLGECSTWHPVSALRPLKRTVFEKAVVYLPHNPEHFLQCWYGDGWVAPRHRVRRPLRELHTRKSTCLMA